MFEQVKDYKNREAAEYAAKTFQPLYMKHIFGID